ncbi:putative death-receptor fusion protein-domain-containing protein [Catenaria anguillulae PL171]|uniref:Putative death-receptor fusion protein-domain-containing protein n=1 Tax=Catenaria anguillulae PL171 TaxID=765915 RepID=A0A1Y2I368_9FUNG|nr:putative death-receptor fusion protein-domain-containing protein [Catenaria anguillulae PL171]
MVLFFPPWHSPAEAVPEPLSRDLNALIPLDSGLRATPKQQDQALKRLATAVASSSVPAAHQWAATYLVPWLTLALVDQRNSASTASRPAILHALHTVSTGQGGALNHAVLASLSSTLRSWLPSLHLADQYAVVQALFRHPVSTQATLESIPNLLQTVQNALANGSASSATFDRVLVLKLAALLVPKLVSSQDLPLALLTSCQSLLVSPTTDADARSLSAVVLVQSLLTHPSHAAPTLLVAPTVTDAALAWSLSLPHGSPRALALRALLASSPSSAHLIDTTTPALLQLITQAGTSVGTQCILAVLDALAITATHLAPNSAQASSILDAMWTFLDDPMDSIQSRARGVVEPLLKKLGHDKAELVKRVVDATVPATKVRYVVMAAVVPVVGPAVAWHACCGTPEGRAEVIESVGRHGMAARVAEFVGAVVLALKKAQPAQDHDLVYSIVEFVVAGLTAPSDLIRKHFASHLLKPILSNLPAVYPLTTARLSALPGDMLAAHVAVERVARTLDLATASSATAATSVPLGAATHPLATLRLDALGLIADVRRPTLALSAADLDWLKHLFTFNLDSTDAEFRDGLLARALKVFERMRHSGYALGRAAKCRPGFPPTPDNVAAQTLIDAYASFLSWLQTLLAAHLDRPACPYAIATTCLGLVDALVIAFGIDAVPMPNGFHKDHCAPPTYPIAVRVDSDTMCRAVLRVVTTAAYEDVQRAAHALVSKFRVPDEMVDQVLRVAKEKVASVRGSEARAGALLWDVVVRAAGQERQSYFIQELIATVVNETKGAQSNLLTAAQASPLPGTLLALQIIFSHVHAPERWIHELASVCQEATQAVLQVLTEDAPEGNLPEDVRADDAEDEVGADEASAASQLILSYSWRVVKHACDLMGVVVERVDAKSYEPLLATVGTHFISLMLSIRHRGAFCAVQPNLVLVTHTLTQSVGSAHLDTWMQSALTAVAHSDYSVTRRSGGLPHVILALLTSQHARYLLPTTMSTLFQLANSSSTADATVKVNAMNTLRRLLDDRHLARDTPAYIEPALLLALEHLHHSDWAVRNGALMLHSNLLTRVFGSRASAGQGDRTSGLTGREFFLRYPKLHAALIRHLRAAVEHVRGEVVGAGMAFPLLVVLARMAPSPAVGGSEDQSVLGAEFEALVGKCLASAVWKVREVAAEALVAMVERERLVQRAVEVVDKLVRGKVEGDGHNGVHGSVLYVRSLVGAAVAVMGQDAVSHGPARDMVMRLVEYVRQSRASPYAQAVAIQVATMVVGEQFARVASEWYSQGIPTGYGYELVKSRLAEAMLLGSDTGALDVLLVQERDPLIHSFVLETLANAESGALVRMLPLSPQVTDVLFDPSAPRTGLRTKILVDAGHSLPTAHLLSLVADPASVALNLRVPLIHSLAKAAIGSATVAATYIDVFTQWSQPEEPLFVREGCTASLTQGLAHVRAVAGSAALARLVWVATTLLVQDDDDDVREGATRALANVVFGTTGGSAVHNSAMLPCAMRWLVEMVTGDAAVRHVVEPLWRETLHKYLVPALTGGKLRQDGLFNKEDPNLFKDQLREAIAVAWGMRQIEAEVESFSYLLDSVKNIETGRRDSQDVNVSLTTLRFLFDASEPGITKEQVLAVAEQFFLA